MDADNKKNDPIVEIVITKDNRQISTKRFEKEIELIHIGRAATADIRDTSADIVLEDVENVISREHSKIRRQGDVFEIMDTSTNHTWLNDEAHHLVVDTWHPLHDGDRIKIKPYILQFSLIHDVLPQKKVVPKDEVAVYKNLTQCADKMSDEIRNICLEFSREVITQYEELKKYLRINFAELDASDAAEVAILLKDRVADVWPDIERIIKDDEILDKKVFRWSDEEQINRASYEALVLLKHKFACDLRAFVFQSDVKRFGEQLERISEIFIESCISLLKSRSKFESEMGIPVTKILGLPQNVVKSKNTSDSLAKYLLNWTEEEHSEESEEALKHALKDLMIHEVALLAGYRQAVPKLCRELIEEVSPDRIVQEAENRQKKKPGILQWWPIRQIREWTFIHRRIEQFRHEDDSTFLKKFDKYFREVYVDGARAGEVMKKRKQDKKEK